MLMDLNCTSALDFYFWLHQLRLKIYEGKAKVLYKDSKFKAAEP